MKLITPFLLVALCGACIAPLTDERLQALVEQVEVDPVTGVVAMPIPNYSTSISETVKAGAEEGMSFLEGIAVGGGSLASVIAAVFAAIKRTKRRMRVKEENDARFAKAVAEKVSNSAYEARLDAASVTAGDIAALKEKG